MEIRLLGPELEHVQTDARRELDETIERRKKEVENEVLANLSEIASDGKRVLKSQKPTYEMMLQLDGLVKENEELFLRVNALCDKTGVSLNAIIERMVAKNRELREKEAVESNNIAATPVEMPMTDEISKKKVADKVSVVATEDHKDSIPSKYEMPKIDLDCEPDTVFNWQKSYLSQESGTVEQNLPKELYATVTEDKPIAFNYDMPRQNVALSAGTDNNASYLKVTGRRLHSWESSRAKNDCLLRVTIFGEDFTNRSDDYRNLSTQIGNLLLHYREFSPEEDNITLDTLDQSIGASKTDVPEKRKLYRKLNFGAKKIESYARANQMAL